MPKEENKRGKGMFDVNSILTDFNDMMYENQEQLILFKQRGMEAVYEESGQEVFSLDVIVRKYDNTPHLITQLNSH